MRSKIAPLSDCCSLLEHLITKRGLNPCFTTQTLWPEPYNQPTLEAAFAFLTECCWTYNEADKTVELIPHKDYIRVIAEEWLNSRNTGKTLIIEKSRRLIASWVLRGLEFWSMGLQIEKRVICGLNYGKASEHVWRVWWLHEELRKRRQELNLDPCTPRGGNPSAQVLDQVILTNGSIIEALNQDGQSFQGSGYAGVCMEEFSLYKHCDYMYGQALRVLDGKPGEVGGHLTIITNASPSTEWQKIKR